MSEENNGPVMLVATTVLRGHKTRIGKIGGNITLPRTIPLVNLAAGSVGAVIGLIAASIINSSFTSILYGIAFGAGAGVFAVTYSPLQGESLMKWFGLTLATKRQQVKIDGQAVRLAIGVAYLSQPARGEVRVRRGAITIPPSQYDERGVLISPKNLNMPDTLDGFELPKRSKEYKDGSVPLPANQDVSLETRTGKKAVAAAASRGNEPKGLKGILGKKSQGPQQAKTSRLEAARAAQQGLTPVQGQWTGEAVSSASADPFNQPLPPGGNRGVPGSTPPGSPAPGYHPQAPMPAPVPAPMPQAGPQQPEAAWPPQNVPIPHQGMPDPFSEPPKRLPKK